jgi:hypothetical protein
VKPYLLLVPACALLLTFGCGPMVAPLPQRLDPESQKKVDDAWTGILTPPDKLGHQDLLDVLVGTFAYQHGVDALSFRSEKRFAGGKVVMGVSFDRTRPDDDRFEVTVYDLKGKELRRERYSRQEIEETSATLFQGGQGENAHGKVPTERRWEKIWSHFPRPEERKAEEAAKPRRKG